MRFVLYFGVKLEFFRIFEIFICVGRGGEYLKFFIFLRCFIEGFLGWNFVVIYYG